MALALTVHSKHHVYKLCTAVTFASMYFRCRWSDHIVKYRASEKSQAALVFHPSHFLPFNSLPFPSSTPALPFLPLHLLFSFPSLPFPLSQGAPPAPPKHLEGLGSTVSSLSGVWGKAPAEKRFSAYLSKKEQLWWQQFCGFLYICCYWSVQLRNSTRLFSISTFRGPG